MMWDEVTHLNGGLLLSHGQLSQWALTNSFYPPVYDLLAAISFLVLGPSIFAARLVSVVFSVLTLFAVYAVANLLLESKPTALVAAVFFAVTPGIVWLSKSAMIETLLVFVVCLCMFFFFRWLKTDSSRDQVFCVAAFAVGVLIKYQVLIVAPVIVLTGMCVWKREYLVGELRKLVRMPRVAVLTAAIVALSVAAVIFLSTKTFDYYLYAFGVGSQEKAFFSTRYPLPVFYLVEMTWFNNTLHPVSVLLYTLGLGGLTFMTFRRKASDKRLLLWFLAVYVIFTLVPNREWRYISIVFPVLAIAAAVLVVSSLKKLQKMSASAASGLSKWTTKIAAVALIGISVAAVGFSCVDASVWIQEYTVEVPVEQASRYVYNNLEHNQTLVVACAVNHFSKYMVMFFFSTRDPTSGYNDTCQTYPNYAMDSFNPEFNASELTVFCQQQNAAYVMLYEYEGLRYFQSELTAFTVIDQLNQTGAFRLVETFGSVPNRIFVFAYKGQ